jgi:hypothetical protein
VVTRRLALQRRRAEARRTRREQAVAEREALPSTEELATRLDLLRHVVDAMRALPEPYRATVLLHFFEELPCSEIAHRQGLPAPTVRTRLRRALDLMREQLDSVHGDRRTWSLALLPLCKIGESAGIAAASAGGAMAIGGLLVSTKIKMAIALMALIGSGLIIWEAAIPRSASRLAAGERSGDSGIAPERPPGPAPGEPDAATEERGETALLPGERSSLANDEIRDAVPPGMLRVSGLVMDLAGRSLPGAEVLHGRDRLTCDGQGA